MSDKLIPYSESFYSVQGEGFHVGRPSVFLRLFGCNLTCKGFSNPSNSEIPLYEVSEDPIVLGCDSLYSWHPSYKDEWRKMNTPLQIAEHVTSLLPQDQWKVNGQGIHLVITGGEPLLHTSGILAILAAIDGLCDKPAHSQLLTDKTAQTATCEALTFETNGTKPLSDLHIDALTFWGRGRELLFSISPKLSHSGETRDKAWVPKAIQSYLKVPSVLTFKFVVRDMDEDFEEILEYLDEVVNYSALVTKPIVYVMPVGSSQAQQQSIQTEVANRALTYGFSYSPRIHCNLWDNQVGV